MMRRINALRSFGKRQAERKNHIQCRPGAARRKICSRLGHTTSKENTAALIPKMRAKLMPWRLSVFANARQRSIEHVNRNTPVMQQLSWVAPLS